MWCLLNQFMWKLSIFFVWEMSESMKKNDSRIDWIAESRVSNRRRIITDDHSFIIKVTPTLDTINKKLIIRSMAKSSFNRTVNLVYFVVQLTPRFWSCDYVEIDANWSVCWVKLCGNFATKSELIGKHLGECVL